MSTCPKKKKCQISWKETIPEDPEKSSKISEEVTEVLLILKWGGELTHTGIQQSQELGNLFREQVYPQDNEGLLRLHSTYRYEREEFLLNLEFQYPEYLGKQLIYHTYLTPLRHDLKIYSSDESRCQKTAAAFCKGYLELDGDLPPILVSLVRKDAQA